MKVRMQGHSLTPCVQYAYHTRCKKETMETVMRFKGRGPPVDWKELATDLLTCISTEEVFKNEAV